MEMVATIMKNVQPMMEHTSVKDATVGIGMKTTQKRESWFTMVENTQMKNTGVQSVPTMMQTGMMRKKYMNTGHRVDQKKDITIFIRIQKDGKMKSASVVEKMAMVD